MGEASQAASAIQSCYRRHAARKPEQVQSTARDDELDTDIAWSDDESVTVDITNVDNNCTITVAAAPSDGVRDTVLAALPEAQTLTITFGGNIVDDHVTMEECGVGDGARLMVQTKFGASDAELHGAASAIQAIQRQRMEFKRKTNASIMIQSLQRGMAARRRVRARQRALHLHELDYAHEQARAARAGRSESQRLWDLYNPVRIPY